MASSVANTSIDLMSRASNAVGQTSAPIPIVKVTETSSRSNTGLLGRVILAILRVIPGVLYWAITFTTITLPTWLFTLFSMSLTFTMNFTTLYAFPVFLQKFALTTTQVVNRRILCLHNQLFRTISIHEHVFPTTPGTAARRTASRSIPRQPRERLEAGSFQLSG
jgi:lysophospholipid hydrolase